VGTGPTFTPEASLHPKLTSGSDDKDRQNRVRKAVPARGRGTVFESNLTEGRGLLACNSLPAGRGGQKPAVAYSAKKERIPGRRDLAMAAIGEKLESGTNLTSEDLVELNRTIYI
jgi:hypothetical protein